MDTAKLKERAKTSLKGKYGEAIKLFVIYYLITFAAGFVIGFLNLNEDISSILELVVSLVITGLFQMGYNVFFLKISRDEKVTYNDLFSKTNLFWLCIGVTFFIGLFTCLWSLLLIVPGIIASISYSMSYYVALDNPELGALEVLKKSKTLMNGHKLDYFGLSLSFIGWAILDVFTLGILSLWLVPYMQVTFANFYNEIKNQ